jgi:site-specific DNA recombinase
MNKAIGYTRVSTIEQTDTGVSLDMQREKIKLHAKLNDLDLIEIISDEGKSGKNLKRKGLQRLIELASNKKIDSVIVYKLDRLVRKTKNLLYLFEDVFNKNNINFFSISEDINTITAQGKFFLTLIGAMAQMERDLISERTSDALQELKRQERRLGSPDKPPFGFRQTKRKKATLENLMPVDEEMVIVKSIYTMRKKDLSLGQIGERCGMAKSSVKYILDNKIYKQKGIIAYS